MDNFLAQSPPHPIETAEELQTAFDYLKSGPFLHWEEKGEDCQIRAFVASEYLLALGVPASQITKEILTGPDLGLYGEHTWSHHCALAITLANGEKWVLDPSLNPEGPLSLEAWFTLAKVGSSDQRELADQVDLSSLENSHFQTIKPYSYQSFSLPHDFDFQLRDRKRSALIQRITPSEKGMLYTRLADIEDTVRANRDMKSLEAQFAKSHHLSAILH